MEKPLISIIMPVYNREHTVKSAIESILGQTYPHFELIVVNDASTDLTSQVIKSVMDDRVHYIELQENKGAAAARNKGIKEANGQWIAFQDSDDVWHENKLYTQVECLLNNKEFALPIIYTSFYRHKRNRVEQIPYDDDRNKNGYIHKELLLGNFISTQTVLMARECLEQAGYFAEDMPRFQDWELWMRLSLKYRFLWIEEPLVDVYYSEGSISADQQKMVLAYEKILIKHKSIFEQAGSQYFASLLFSYGHNLCLCGNMKQGRKMLIQSFYQNAFSFKTTIALISSILGRRFYNRMYSYYNQ